MIKLTKTELRRVMKESSREADKYKNNVDLSKSHLNLHSHDSAKEMYNAMNARLKELQDEGVKVRKDVKLYSKVTHIPKQYLEVCKDDNDILEYFGHCIQFSMERFGEKNIIGWSIHFDETGPHLHEYGVPETISRKSGKRTVSVASLWNKKQLSSYHNDLDDYLERELETPLARTQNGTIKERGGNIEKLEDYKEYQDKLNALNEQNKALLTRSNELDDREHQLEREEAEMTLKKANLDKLEKALESSVDELEKYVNKVNQIQSDVLVLQHIRKKGVYDKILNEAKKVSSIKLITASDMLNKHKNQEKTKGGYEFN